MTFFGPGWPKETSPSPAPTRPDPGLPERPERAWGVRDLVNRALWLLWERGTFGGSWR